jgi:NAD(P)-dependent dehydrogenase (short-subunit alcohol dehydrogenase family)
VVKKWDGWESSKRCELRGKTMSKQAKQGILGQTVVVIGGSAGMGFETAILARSEGADVVLVGRNPQQLARAAAVVGTSRTASFDANDPVALAAFFEELEGPIDHVMVTAGGPTYGPCSK